MSGHAVGGLTYATDIPIARAPLYVGNMAEVRQCAALPECGQPLQSRPQPGIDVAHRTTGHRVPKTDVFQHRRDKVSNT